MSLRCFLPLILFTSLASFAGEQLPGHQSDNSVLLPNQWSIHPAGRQVTLGSLPVNIAVHPRGKYAAVLHSGYGPHEVIVVDLSAGKITSRVPIHETFYGVTFSHNGRELWCSGGGDEVIHRFAFHDGQLTNDVPVQIHDKNLRGVPSGFALDNASRHLFVANVWGDCVTRLQLQPSITIKDMALGPRPSSQSLAPLIPPSEFDSAEGAERRGEIGFYSTSPDDTFPYACCLDEKRQRLYVSLWAKASVRVLDAVSGETIATWPTDEHPCEMTLTRSGQRLYVANANRNTISVFDTRTGLALETISSAFFPDSPPGSTPNSLALSPDEKTLYVANAGVNTIAVFDVSIPRKSRALGFIPAGWFPTSVRVTPDGKKLLVANGKGNATHANPRGPAPGKKTSEYIADLYPGTLSIIDLPRGKNAEAQMAAWTAEVYHCTPLKKDASVSLLPPTGNPVPASPQGTSPIKYCIYIIKENRTYDQVLGDMPGGNGDPKICLFPEKITPNEHQLARDFVLLDNFYADAEVSAAGHEWSLGAYCSDFVERMWPQSYGHNKNGKFPFPAEGYFPIAAPRGGYIWDRAIEANLSFRDYGEFVSYDQTPDQPSRPRVKALQGHIDPGYRGFDLKYSDLLRADRFIAEFKRLEAADDMPRLQIVRLPNDHTHGTTTGFPTPTAYIAENDFALGRIVDTISHSKYWPQTAIFVVEDDAQNGADHVDAHRTLAFVVSPYSRKRGTDSTMYSTSSMLRTIELILGLKPMTQFDAAAHPMYGCFQPTPDTRPWDGLPANVDLNAKNKHTAWGADLKMNFAREDAADDLLLNEAVWRSVRGPNSQAPAPVHAAFVFSHKDGDDDD